MNKNHPPFHLKALIVILLCSCFIAGCSGEKQKPPAPAAPVAAATVAARDVPVELRAIGNAEAFATVAIKARIGGQVQQVNFREGQDVSQGDLLFVIDPRPHEAALKEAQAKLARDNALYNKAAADARRYGDLVRQDFVSREAYEQARATADSLEAVVKADEVVVENARLNLSYCYIKAPLTGRTGALLADVGNLIKADADKAMLVINQIQPIYVAFAVPEQHLAEVRRHLAQGRLPVKALIPGEDKNPEFGFLSFVDNTVDTATGAIRCKGAFPNRDKRLWPGQFVNVVVEFAVQTGAIVAPAPAIQSGQQGTFVFVISPDNTVALRPVTVARTFNGEAIISQGLSAGERVVNEGQLRLTPGAKVEIKGSP